MVTRAFYRWHSKSPGDGGRRFALSRRALLASAFAGLLEAQKAEVSGFDLSLLDQPLTPVELFFVREHFPAPAVSAPSRTAGTSGELSHSRLRMPLDGEAVESLKGGFAETRGGNRPHEAVDMLAPRNTPIHAVESGTIAKLFTSKAGGLTIYQFDPAGHLCYYYAHLERYASGLKEGDKVRKGQVIGYVGTSGNAPKNTPHLHFAIFKLTAAKHWWEGTPIDPYDILR